MVFVVDDDDAVRRALCRLIGSAGYRVQGFGSAAEFLRVRPCMDGVACLVLDVQMPELDGLELQGALNAANAPLPIIFLTGHGDIAMTVRAMKAGAIDFLAKPVRDVDLLQAVEAAVRHASRAQAARIELDSIRNRLARLTPREREVLALLLAGRLNKQAAYELGIAEKTIKVHRARVMEKMEARSLVELARAADKVGVPFQPAGQGAEADTASANPGLVAPT
jgi:FixJ family two-component response regulator